MPDQPKKSPLRFLIIIPAIIGVVLCLAGAADAVRRQRLWDDAVSTTGERFRGNPGNLSSGSINGEHVYLSRFVPPDNIAIVVSLSSSADPLPARTAIWTCGEQDDVVLGADLATHIQQERRQQIEEQISNVDWNSLEHAYGDAADTADHLRSLMDDNLEKRDAALEELFGSILHQGSTYDATVPAISILIEIAKARILGTEESLIFLSEALNSTCDWDEWTEEELEYIQDKRIFDTLTANRDLFFECLNDDNQKLRNLAANCLRFLPDDRGEVTNALRQRFDAEMDLTNRVTMVRAVVELGQESMVARQQLKEWSGDQYPAAIRYFAYCQFEDQTTEEIDFFENLQQDATAVDQILLHQGLPKIDVWSGIRTTLNALGHRRNQQK
ncbi:MAG: hypothetical protein CMJ78_17740 [Planctomycetaceae bacterium]|nr:hypothetical protein [Planctomycetaceae bacterium]